MSLRAVAFLLLPALAVAAATATAPVRRSYVDRENGVLFTYPSGWLLNGDDDAATAKLRITVGAQPNAVVQLEGNFAETGPYQGTDFESGAFAYVVKPNTTQSDCFAVPDQSATDTQKAETIRWNGLPAKRLEATYSIAGAEDRHRILAVFRKDRCYLFESVIVRTNPEAVAHRLEPRQWRQIRAAFDGVLQSVRLTPPAGAGNRD